MALVSTVKKAIFTTEARRPLDMSKWQSKLALASDKYYDIEHTKSVDLILLVMGKAYLSHIKHSAKKIANTQI